MKKFCTKCGHGFEAVGREVICPACKAAAAEDAKRAAVMRAKRASWAGESVPVRISGRASTVIREYGKVNNLSFAAALDGLLKASDYFASMGVKWDSIEPYKSRRRDKHATETETAAVKPVKPVKPVKQAAKTSTSKAAKPVKQAAKTSTSKAAKKEEKKL